MSAPEAEKPDTNSPAPAPSAPAPEVQKGSEYDLDTSIDSELDVTSAPVASEAAPAPKPAPSRPRDPDTGKFVKPPEHSSRTLRMAKDLGLSDEEIAATAPDSLDDIVYHLNKRAMADARAAKRDEMTWSATEPRQQPKSETAEPAKPAQVQDEWESFSEADGPEDVDPRIAKTFNKLTSKIKQLEALVGTLTHREISREHMTATQKVDAAIASLGADAFFGTGPVDALPKGSIERERREAIVARAKKLAGPTATPDDIAAKIPEAKSFFGLSDSAPTPAKPAKARISEEAWKEAGLNRPTQRVGPAEPKGDKRATKAAANWMRENGYYDDETELDGFPD